MDENYDRIASQYYREVGQLPSQTAAREKAQFEQYREARDTGNKTKASRLRHEIACGYVKFVMQRAHRRTKNRDLRLDLIAEGNIGLMVAIDKFDVEREYRFLTYAAQWIEVYMREFINKSLPVHMPNHKRKELRRTRAAEDKLIMQGLLREHTAHEPSATSIDNVSVASPTEAEDEVRVSESDVLGYLAATGLTIRERFVIVHHFGLRGGGPRNFRNVAALAYRVDGSCMTSEQIRQTRDAAMAKLGDHLRSIGIASVTELM